MNQHTQESPFCSEPEIYSNSIKCSFTPLPKACCLGRGSLVPSVIYPGSKQGGWTLFSSRNIQTYLSFGNRKEPCCSWCFSQSPSYQYPLRDAVQMNAEQSENYQLSRPLLCFSFFSLVLYSPRCDFMNMTNYFKIIYNLVLNKLQKVLLEVVSNTSESFNQF